LRHHCEQNGQSPRIVLEGLAAGTVQLPYSGKLVNRFTELQARLAALLPLDVPHLIDSLFPDGTPDAALIRQIALLVAPNAANVKDFVSELRVAVTQPELPGPQGNAVRIMSLHKSKGLTARLVVIAGCVSGIIPSIDFQAPLGEQNRQREEQRRLFYVGITRSTETLVLSNGVRMPYGAALQMRMPVAARRGGYAILQASPFLGELGPAAPAAVSGTNWRAQIGF
jgi:superfamily I DNA/RNA helicase